MQRQREAEEEVTG